MKKIFSILLIIISASPAIAQWKKTKQYVRYGHGQSHLSVSAKAGYSQFLYALDDANAENTGGFGYGLNVNYWYYFKYNWGIATGAGLTYYGSNIKYAGSFNSNPLLEVSGMIDEDTGEEYSLRYTLKNWQERQQAYMVEIPVMISFQTPLYLRKRIFVRKLQYRNRFIRANNSQWRFYANAGGKLMLPVFGNHCGVMPGSELSVWGYYPQYDINFGNGENLVEYGFGTNKNIAGEAPFKQQKLLLKPNFAVSVEIGITARLHEHSKQELMLGITADYGINSIRKGSKENSPLLGPDSSVHQTNHRFIGDHTIYSGFINSSMLKNNRINTLFIGFKTGLRFGLGK
ncbi:MAG: hypothetical protein LBV41_13120 [Cytophagaceae bacterium]|jgi:hypothetical protein|nr:hypothetical protein [Cytophagaceae bacterium]